MTREEKKEHIRQAVHMAQVNTAFVLSPKCCPNVAAVKLCYDGTDYYYCVYKPGAITVYKSLKGCVTPINYKTETWARKALCNWLISDWI